MPGDLFSRTDVIRTQRELNQLNYFNPEAFGINPVQNPEDGTVDIEYVVEEKPTDQIELQGGWGGGRIVGSLGVTFNNFAVGKAFKKGLAPGSHGRWSACQHPGPIQRPVLPELQCELHRTVAGRQEAQCVDRGGLAFHPEQRPAEAHRRRGQSASARPS